VLAIAIMVSVDWRLAAFAVMPAPAVSFAVVFFGRRIHDRFEKLQEMFSDISSRVQENLSGVRMVRAFVLNAPYPTAPFSTLYLFGRGQDIGFQKAIDNSPRKRHHIRFWALSLAQADAMGTASFWLNTDRPPDDAAVLWVGAGTRDTGFSLTQLTFQVTHATDSDTNAERDYIVAELRNSRVIADVTSYHSGEPLPVKRVNHYVTDGEITLASLAVGEPGGG